MTLETKPLEKLIPTIHDWSIGITVRIYKWNKITPVNLTANSTGGNYGSGYVFADEDQGFTVLPSPYSIIHIALQPT